MLWLKLPKKYITRFTSLFLSICIALLSLTFLPKQNTWAASVSWDGGASTANWSDALNWSTDTVPNADDDVLIDVSTTVNIAASTTINSLTLGNSGGTTAPILNFAYDSVGTSSPLVLDSGDLTINNGATLTHSAGTTAIVGTIAIEIQNGDAVIATGGKIDVTGKGYKSTEGAGQGVNGTNANGAGGGAYGGNGGNGESGFLGGVGYGQIKNPMELGSGGGDSGYSGRYGGTGGGLVKLNIAGTLDLEGDIYSNGGPSNGYDGGSVVNYAGGGGSGGGINITVSTITGNGDITANGSNGFNAGKADAGGGGGGRIAIEYTTNTYTGSFQVNGGLGPDDGLNGGAGTLYLDDGTGNGDLIISTSTTRPIFNEGFTVIDGAFDSTTISGYSCVDLVNTLDISESLILEDNAHLKIESTSTTTYGTFTLSDTPAITDRGGDFALINDNASLTIPAGTTLHSDTPRTYDSVEVSGTWTHTANYTAQTYILDVDVTNDLTINSGGKIDVTGKGYKSTEGSGAGTDGNNGNGAGGGAYGGNGGNGESGFLGGTSYGDQTNPIHIGSGGGDSAYAERYGGTGGGLVILDIGGTFDLQGNIYSNGGPSNGYDGGSVVNYSGGGGSGGGVNITVANFTGSGDITTNGSNGFNSGKADGGGGGGGRIAIYCSTNSYTGSLEANGGLGPDDALDGQVGTIYPNITTIVENSASDIAVNSATISANISAIPIVGTTDTGFLWGTDPTLVVYTQESLGQITQPETISKSLSGLTPSTTYYFRAYVVSSGATTYGDITSFETLADNETPTALDANITGETDIFPGKSLNIQSIYSDGDGAVDLEKLYLQIDNPSGTDIEYYATSAGTDQTGQTPTAVSGSEYLSSITYDIDFQSPTANDITVTWHITPNWTWTRDTTIAYGVKAVDIDTASSVYDYTTSTYTYENRLTFTGAVTAIDDENNNISESSWTPANLPITFSGIKVVFVGTTVIYPNDSDFNVMLVNDSATEWFDNTSSGENISIEAATSATTNTNDEYIFSITDIPTGGSDVSSTSFFLKTDNTTPVISSLTSSTHPTQTTWYTSSDITISWSATDNQSGIYKTWRLIDKVQTQTNEYQQSNGTEVNASGTYSTTLPSEGTWYIHLLVRDNHGLITTQTFKVMIDSQSPLFSSITSTSHPSQTAWYSNKTALVTWDTTDTSSNVEAVWRLLDQTSTRSTAEVLASGVQAQEDMTWTTPDLTSGTWYLHLVAKDFAEQTTYAKYTLKIDLSTPDIVAVTGSNNGVLQNTNSGPVISWTDPNSLSDDTFYITNNGTNPTSSNYAYTTTSATYDLPNQGEGETVIKVRAMTTAGTYSTTRSFTIRYDSIAPANVTNFTATPSETSVALSWTNPSTSDLNRVIVMRSDLKIPTSTSEGTKVYEGTNNTYSDNGLTKDTTYYYTIFSLDALSNRSTGTTTQAKTTNTQTVTEQPSTIPQITEDTTVINVSELPEEHQVSIIVDQQETTPTNAGEINTYTGQIVKIEVPASAITSNSIDTQTVLLVIGDQAYVMEYNTEKDSYSATVNTPSVKGVYTTTIQTVSKENLSQLAITMTLKVDPYGYVYTKFFGNEIRLSNAKVSLYKKVNDQPVLWQPNDTQVNPQTTGKTGEFNFFVEPGEYKIVVEAKGYSTQETEWITVESNVIEKDIQMNINPLIIFSSIAIFLSLSFVIFYFIPSRKYKKI